ncbi:MAG: hypothetical protein NT013_02725 [Planctomycetia bacterium]|nr:hypothetical protein [Planctomycetia bacterium]
MLKSLCWNGLIGLFCGLALMSGAAQYWLSCGTSLPAQTGLAIMVGLALVTSMLLRKSERVGLLAQACGMFLLSASTLALPTILNFLWSAIAGAGTDPFASTLSQITTFTGIACVTLGVPTLCVLLVLTHQSHVVTLAFGMCVAGFAICPWLGPQACGVIAAALGLVSFLISMIGLTATQTASAPNSSDNSSNNISRNALASGCGSQAPETPVFPTTRIVCWCVSFLALGLLWSVGQRLVRQIVPDSFALMTAEWAVAMLCAAAGTAWTRFHRVQAQSPLVAGVMVASWFTFCLAMFPMSVYLALSENANVSQVWLLMPLRLLFAAVVLGPIAYCGGLLVNAQASGRAHSIGSSVALLLVLFAATVTNWLLLSIGVEAMAMAAIVTLLATVAVSGEWRPWVSQMSEFKKAGRFARLRIGCIVAMVLMAISAPAFVRYRPALAAKLLFDTNVFLAFRAGAPWGQLAVMDDCRVAIVAESEHGTLTAWKAHGSQFLVRENGVPRGTLASNADLAPRYLPDVLPSLLPLIVHEHPQQVLLLGMRAGEPLSTTAAFPVQRVLCIEADRGVVELCRKMMEPAGALSPFADDRFETRISDPSIAVRTLKEKFDLVISSPDQPSLPQAAVWFTEESLRAAAGCVKAGGLFALRFQHVDLTTKSVRILAKTMSSIFREVAAVEMAPGELLLLGTNSDRGFMRDGFVERLQRPHVRQMLASIGWDWSTPLRMGLQNAAAIEKLTAHQDAVSNRSATSTWPFQLPIDVMRWDNKLEQTRNVLAKNTHYLMQWGGQDADTPDVATRISEWELSRQIIRLHPDEYWAYRKQVKDHLTKSQRAIQQVSLTQTESGLHPDDDRRLRYFRAIGEASKNAHPREADLARIRRYEFPFDPLVSPFLHQEVIELTHRCDDRNANLELRHRLAAIYFSTNADRSIRNVADALQFVSSTPEAIPDKAERYDHLNSLIQMLSNRWLARGAFSPTTSRVALNDIERSIAAMEAAFTTIDALASEGAIPSADWTARRQFMDRRLVRPLRTYRGEVMQHYVKNERTKEAAANPSEAAPVNAADVHN